MARITTTKTHMSGIALGGIGAGGMEVLKQLTKGGGFKGIISTMFTGKKGGNIAEAGREVAEGAATMGKMQSGLSSIFRGWGQIATMVGGTAFVGWASFKAFKSMLKDIREMTNIASGIDWSVGKKVLAGMGGFFGSFAALSASTSSFAMSSAFSPFCNLTRISSFIVFVIWNSS